MTLEQALLAVQIEKAIQLVRDYREQKCQSEYLDELICELTAPKTVMATVQTVSSAVPIASSDFPSIRSLPTSKNRSSSLSLRTAGGTTGRRGLVRRTG